MEVTDRDIERIPPRNIHVPRDEFAAVWVVASRYPSKNLTDWYGAGVTHACRWMANGIERPSNGLWRPAPSPVTYRSVLAYEELIVRHEAPRSRVEVKVHHRWAVAVAR